METAINSVLAEMQPILESHQLKRLSAVLKHALNPEPPSISKDLLVFFPAAKENEDCSRKLSATALAPLPEPSMDVATSSFLWRPIQYALRSEARSHFLAPIISSTDTITLDIVSRLLRLLSSSWAFK